MDMPVLQLNSSEGQMVARVDLDMIVRRFTFLLKVVGRLYLGTQG